MQRLAYSLLNLLRPSYYSLASPFLRKVHHIRETFALGLHTGLQHHHRAVVVESAAACTAVHETVAGVARAQPYIAAALAVVYIIVVVVAASLRAVVAAVLIVEVVVMIGAVRVWGAFVVNACAVVAEGVLAAVVAAVADFAVVFALLCFRHDDPVHSNIVESYSFLLSL